MTFVFIFSGEIQEISENSADLQSNFGPAFRKFSSAIFEVLSAKLSFLALLPFCTHTHPMICQQGL